MSDVQNYYPMIETVDDKNKLVQSCPEKYVVFPSGPQRDEDIAADREERQWREWVDGRFIHLISPNVYRTFDESLETFKWFSEVNFARIKK
ncbi:hypothetical protein OESDEN_01732 [Oesophagostomum dentatum]|uniref:Uncharacterized protein n=1 Tax=Oesophagostomum dentatum TaxID=61180 RepID=A0A0B1TR39_OESDE|nr:hypothetical protein OESDEN_01732 [Oesophagostomum dentatum]